MWKPAFEQASTRGVSGIGPVLLKAPFRTLSAGRSAQAYLISLATELHEPSKIQKQSLDGLLGPVQVAGPGRSKP
jgi:hypothetical protein